MLIMHDEFFKYRRENDKLKELVAGFGRIKAVLKETRDLQNVLSDLYDDGKKKRRSEICTRKR